MRLRRTATPGQPDKTRQHAQERLSRLTTGDVLNWADQAGTGVSRALDDYRRTGDVSCLQEAQEGLSALAGVLDVLLNRAQAG